MLLISQQEGFGRLAVRTCLSESWHMQQGMKPLLCPRRSPACFDALSSRVFAHRSFSLCAVPTLSCLHSGDATPRDPVPEPLSLTETARRMRDLLSALETRSKSIGGASAFAVDHAARGGADCIADVIAEWATSVRPDVSQRAAHL